jgi:hypothetical protein
MPAFANNFVVYVQLACQINNYIFLSKNQTVIARMDDSIPVILIGRIETKRNVSISNI